jgi:hypothetical protein
MSDFSTSGNASVVEPSRNFRIDVSATDAAALTTAAVD